MTETTIAPLTLPRSGRRWRVRPAVWLTAPGILFLLAFFLLPTLQIMSVSLFDRAGLFSLDAYGRLFSSSVYFRVLTTTFTVAVEVTFACLLFGYPLAYWLSRMSARRQRMLLMLILVPFWTSPLVLNFSWLVLLGHDGIVQSVLRTFGAAPRDILFNRVAVIFAMTHTMVPLAVVTMLPVMNTIDKRLGQAALTLGATASDAFWRIFFRLSMRGVATAGLLVFMSSLGFFITPALVGGRQDTMISQLIIQLINSLQNWQLGSALAVVLVAAALAAILVYDRVFGLSSMSGGQLHGTADGWTRRAGHRATAAFGRLFGAIETGIHRHLRGLGRLDLLSAYSWLAILVLLCPIAGFVAMAFTDASFLAFPVRSFGTRWFEVYVASPVWVGATFRSFGIGIATAVLTLLIAGMAAFGLARARSRIASLAFLLFMAPMVVPPIVIAIALFYLFAHLHLIATDLAIVIGHAVIGMPIVFVVLLTTFKGHDWRLDQVAATLGANAFQVLRRITFPLLAAGLVVGFVTGFLQSFEELTVAIFLGGGLITTLPKQMWDNVLLQLDPTIAAASVVVLAIIVVMFVTMELVQRRYAK